MNTSTLCEAGTSVFSSQINIEYWYNHARKYIDAQNDADDINLIHDKRVQDTDMKMRMLKDQLLLLLYT